jgi:hypothetical protein
MEWAMRKRPTMGVFPACNDDGRQLAEGLVALGGELDYDVQIREPKRPIHGPDAADSYMRSCHEYDLVILDGTIAPRGQHNYEFAVPLPLDTVFVVGRSHLPLNFGSLRDSVAGADGKLLYNSAFFGQTLSNAELLARLRLQLAPLRSVLPREPRPGGPLAGFVPFLPGSFKSSLDALDRRRGQGGEVFLSYRAPHHAIAEELAADLAAGRHGVPRSARFFSPGELSVEVAPQQRRWQILSAIDRFIGPASELWIVETEDYYESWWTLGELATLAYRRNTGYRGQVPPRLRIFDPGRAEVRDAPDDFLPHLSAEQEKRFARWFANSDAMTTGPEAVVAMYALRHVPLLGRLGYFNDLVWSEEFWRHSILECPRCRVLGRARNRFHVDDFLWTRGLGFTRVPPEEMQHCMSSGGIVCPSCSTRYPLQSASPQYLWVPLLRRDLTATLFRRLFELPEDDPEEVALIALPAHRFTGGAASRETAA